MFRLFKVNKKSLKTIFFGFIIFCFIISARSSLAAGYIWTDISSHFPDNSHGVVWYFSVSSADGSHLLTGVYGGRVYISADYGATWAETQPKGDNLGNWVSGAISADGSHLILVAYNGRVYTSADYGATWTERQLLGDANKTWWSVASDADGSYLAVGMYPGRLYTSADYGATWAETQPAGNTDKNWYGLALSDDGSHLAAGANSGRLYTSANYGATWVERQPAGATNKNWFSIGSDSDGSNLIAAFSSSSSGGRFYTSTDYGATWTERKPAGDVNKKWYIVSSDSTGSHLIAGVSGGRIYTSADAGATWTETQPLGNVDGGWRAADIGADGSRMVAASSGGFVYTSSDYGATWTERRPGGDAGNWKSGASNSDGSLMIVGSAPGRLYISRNYGLTWTETQPAGDADRSWYGLASSDDGSHLIVGGITGGLVTSGRLYTSADYGATWTERQPAGNIETKWRTGMASDSSGAHLIASIYGASLYVSSDYGVNWSASSLGSQLWKCAGSSSDGSHMFVGVENGRLYTSADYGATWLETRPAGDASRGWYTCSISPDGSKLIAGTNDDNHIFISADFGATWSSTIPDANNANGWIRSAFSQDGNHVIISNQSRYFTSSDFGVNWSEVRPVGDTNRSWEIIATNYNASRLLAGINGGFIYSGILDSTPPLITLLGSSSISINRGSTYVDAGATALDDYSGDLTNSITINNPVNTNVAGIYTITYNVSDGVGNIGTATRTVHVLDVTPPVLTLLGPNSVAINPGQSYTDEGAVAIDDNDGNITSSISVFNPLDINTVGTYDIIYSVTDSSGNTNRITRVVHVNAPGYLPQTSYQTPAQLVMSSQSSSTPGGSAVSTPIFTINDNLPFTTSNPTVTLKFNNFNNPLITKLAISTSTDFTTSSLINYTPTYSYNLCGNNNPVSNSTATTTANCPNGPYTIYAKYYTDYGQNTLAGPLNINLDRGASSATVLLPKDTVSPISTSTAPVSPSNPSSSLASRLSGRILLQVQDKGQAWYVNPTDSKRYSLGSPDNAFSLMRELALGISNDTFNSFKNNTAPKRLSGRILLNVQDFGKAYYVNPTNLKLYYLGRPADAFSVMRTLGLGVTNEDLNKIFEN